MIGKPDRVDLVDDLRALQGRIANLCTLLDLQRRQVEAWNAKLYDSTAAGAAARRLLFLKHGR